MLILRVCHFAPFLFNSQYCVTGLHPTRPLLKYSCMSKYKFSSIILFISLFSKRVDLWQFLIRNGRPWANGGQFFPIFCNTSIGNGSDLPCLLLTIVYLIRVSVRISKNLSFQWKQANSLNTFSELYYIYRFIICGAVGGMTGNTQPDGTLFFLIFTYLRGRSH